MEHRDSSERLDADGFSRLMTRLASAWESLNTEEAVSCFAPDAVYMEPPDVQLFQTHEELRAYFGALKGGTFMRLHNVWFNEESQIGAAEYSFGLEDSPQADHGVAVVEVVAGQIARWREYQVKGPTDFSRFTAANGKDWQWQIGNYP